MKHTSLIIFLPVFVGTFSYLTAMDPHKLKPTITPQIAAVAQAALQEGPTRKKVVDKLTAYGVNLDYEKQTDPKAYTKLIQLGAMFLGSKGESDMLKEMRLVKYQRNSYYKKFFKKYPYLSDALIELAEIKDVQLEKRGKQE